MFWQTSHSVQGFLVQVRCCIRAVQSVRLSSETQRMTSSGRGGPPQPLLSSHCIVHTPKRLSNVSTGTTLRSASLAKEGIPRSSAIHLQQNFPIRITEIEALPFTLVGCKKHTAYSLFIEAKAIKALTRSLLVIHEKFSQCQFNQCWQHTNAHSERQ